MDKIVKYILIFVGILLFAIGLGLYLLAKKVGAGFMELWNSPWYPVIAGVIGLVLIWISTHYNEE